MVTKILYLMKKFTHTNQKNKETVIKVTESMATRSLGLTNLDLEVEEEEEWDLVLEEEMIEITEREDNLVKEEKEDNTIKEEKKEIIMIEDPKS